MNSTQVAESAADLWTERSNFAGIAMGALAYGLHLAVFSISLFYVFKAPALGKTSWLFAILLFAFLGLGTIQVAAQVKFGELVWIDYRNFPGGPVAWYHGHYNNIYNTLEFGGFISANFLADAVLLYRMFVVWDRNLLVMIIPILAFTASTSLSIVSAFEAAQPHSSKWSHASFEFELPYWALTVSLNLLITVAVVYRLLTMRRAVISIFGADHATMYTSIISMVVESAAIYATTGIVCIVAFATKSNILNFLQPILGQVVCICPELIILRVHNGRAWTTHITRTVNAHRLGTQSVEASENGRSTPGPMVVSSGFVGGILDLKAYGY
ncbi:hypothetical protein SCHPADRAFT_236961 [Schizopora paradoxa]|uniref:Uncharacterized protein n=1 Tax=Schizopora paradoxa TaxID=27342 RepID=A0A0H2RVW5_9AGAM|nr:hypothetical protein SCHPADRAFT_236961 [Schizopora paradoxa]